MEFAFHLADEAQTLRLGEILARHRPRQAVIYLHGELGAGKTTLSRGFIHACGFAGKVKSPTYTLMESYPLDDGVIHHLDLYRLTDPEELAYLGIDALDADRAIVLVEWPERGAGALPDPDVTLTLRHEKAGRHLVAEPHREDLQAWIEDAHSHFA